jgi:hypothetical protein
VTLDPTVAHRRHHLLRPAALHAPLSAQLGSVVLELGGRPEVRVELLPDLADLTAVAVVGW